MTKTEKQDFKVNEIYGIRKNDNGKWVSFNRDYKPLGRDTKDQIPDGEYPINGIPANIEREKLQELAFADKGQRWAGVRLSLQ